jgi:transcriptional regulator with XRE-family HTH domain
MATESLPVRVRRLILEAVRAGRFKSEADFLKQVGLSNGYLGEQASRKNATKPPSLRVDTVQQMAELLGMKVSELIGENPSDPPVDIYEGRAWAIDAARRLKLPEAAIQLVLAEDPGRDPGRMYWFRRIEAESERIRPASEL